MRRLEAAATAIFFLYASHLIFPSIGREWAIAVLGAGLLAIACHAGLEGCRWQMVPAYFLAGALPLYEAIHLLGGNPAPVLAAIAILPLELATVALCIMMPIFRLPTPSGPYKIGTEARYLVDESRSDPFSDRPGGWRELVIQIWYPADATAAGRYAPYREKSITT